MSKAIHNPVYWVIACLCTALLPQIAGMPLHIIPFMLFPVAWRLLAEIRGWKPMHALLRLPITILTLTALVMTYGNMLGRRAAISLLALMLALKLLETFRTRDERVIASLSLFFCSTQFLFNQGLSMLFYGASCMVLSLAALAVIARRESFAETARQQPAETQLFAELTLSAKLLLLAIPVGVVLFLFFPRWGSPLWGVPERSLDAKSGLSDSMTPGSIQGLFMDDSPAFRATFEAGLPPAEERYWRGPVLWDFDGRTWGTRWFGRNNEAAVRPDIDGAPFRYEVQMEPNERHWLFALDYPAMVPTGVRLTRDFQLISSKAITDLRTYTMASDPDFTAFPELETVMRDRALALPDDFNPRTRAMIDAWRTETPTDAALVRRTLAHFRDEPFRYTLNPALLTRHSVDEFLFDTREGFCEHYASTFVVMMRMAGIPSRVVTGYQGGWFNTLGNYLLVRQSDAHAWAETWLPGTGWVRIDPTAAVSPDRVERSALDALSGRRHLLDFAWLRQLRNGFDNVNRFWNDWVIAFDAARQSGILGFIGISKLEPRMLVLLLGLMMLIVSAIMAPWLLRWGQLRERDPGVRHWRRFVAGLAKSGVPATLAMAPTEVAQSLESHLGSERHDVRRIAALYQSLRYALVKPDIKEFEQAIRTFRLKA